MADNPHSPAPPIERGIAMLHRWLGDSASLLKQAQPKESEAVSFEYPLPSDYTGVVRTIRIAFPHNFPTNMLQINVEPSPWLKWPHAMRNGLCLFDPRQRPVSGTPEDIVEENLRRLGQLLMLVMPDSDASRRQREFEDEIVSYWSPQLHANPGQLIMLQRPIAASPLFALSDKRPRKRAALNSIWLAQDAAALARHWKRMTG